MLVLDIGNTKIKYAVFEGDDIQASDSFLCQPAQIDESLAKAFADKPQTEVAICSVASESVLESVSRWFETQWSITPAVVRVSSEALGVTNAYAQYSELGADRWAAIIAAYTGFRQAVCVIDCGTAITVDVVDKHGGHQGGLIMPGIAMGRQCLVAGASGISHLQGRLVDLARNTADAVASGYPVALAAGIDAMIGNLRRRYGGSMQMVLTGGDWELISSLITSAHHTDPLLVLKGTHLLQRFTSL